MCSQCDGDYENPAMTTIDDLVPLEESDLEMDLRCSGSYAEAQARLARALDALTDLALKRPV